MTADDMTLRVLIDIQAKLADQLRRFDSLDERPGLLDRRLDELHETLYTSFGISGHANVKTDMLQREIEASRIRDSGVTRG